MEAVEQDILANEGTAYVLPVTEGERFIPLFDRSEDYSSLRNEVETLRLQLAPETAMTVAKQVRKLRRSFSQTVDIDFFPGEAQKQVDDSLSELEHEISRAVSADEPHSFERPIRRLELSDYQGRTWATRRRPWVDRLASAWLIRQHIDPAAAFLWLEHPDDCPEGVLGFDFDGAAFSHVGKRVTFETLLASFGLETPALLRMGNLVHYLDVGGTQPVEAAGIERVLAGLRASIEADDQLLSAATAVFDGLLSAFEGEQADE